VGSYTQCGGLERVVVQDGKSYLLRLIGAQSLDMIDFSVEGHDLMVVEAVSAGYTHTHTHSQSTGRPDMRMYGNDMTDGSFIWFLAVYRTASMSSRSSRRTCLLMRGSATE
jgi:hypothetical protein